MINIRSLLFGKVLWFVKWARSLDFKAGKKTPPKQRVYDMINKKETIIEKETCFPPPSSYFPSSSSSNPFIFLILEPVIIISPNPRFRLLRWKRERGDIVFLVGRVGCEWEKEKIKNKQKDQTNKRVKKTHFFSFASFICKSLNILV